MKDPGEKDRGSIRPLTLAASVGTAALCLLIIYNAVAGQDGRQRNVISRLSDLEQQGALPVTIGAGSFDARPTTKTRVGIVGIQELAELATHSDADAAPPAERTGNSAPSPPPVDMDVRSIQEGLARLGYSPGAVDGALGPRTREAIRMYERDRDRQETGTITPELIMELQRVFADADSKSQP